jgi:pantoate--beta-alanine ligase
MQVINTIVDLRLALNRWRSTGESVAFVPTMGNLHAGHLRLVEEARLSADRVIVSIFVNPTQFGQGEDFESYPRTMVEDKQKLSAAAIDALFLPDTSEMYGEGAKTIVSVKNLSSIHCGVTRPSHFDGVATVVCKLLNIVQPDVAFFGQKDYQQLLIILTMVSDLNIPVEIRSIETVREGSGLAMSSRNGYLNPRELKIAPTLYQVLCAARDEVIFGEKPLDAIENEAVDRLKESGFIPDYFTVCNQHDLRNADRQKTDFAILAAAYLGRTRLIDNVFFSVPS